VENQHVEMESTDLRLDRTRSRVADAIARFSGGQTRQQTAVPGLALYHFTAPNDPTSGVYQPCLCAVMQGSKMVLLGDESYVYDAETYLITSLHLPTVARVLDASPERPFLALTLAFDLEALSRLMADKNLPPPPAAAGERAMATAPMTLPLMTALERLVDLLGQPDDIPIMAPLLQREILYRLLQGDLGVRLRRMAALGSQGHRIARAIDWLRENYADPLQIETLSAEVGMSPSTFHQHFRAATAMSPLQYQKQLRLQEARRLMLTDDVDAATAGFRVGYGSPSQFSREYARQYGAPPMRDISGLRAVRTSGVAAE